MKLVVAMTGATGVVYGIRLLEALRDMGVETYLVLSRWAEETIRLETKYDPAAVRLLASHTYDEDNLVAPIASGSFLHQGMVIIPCSMKTLAGIAHGYAANLIQRAADVTLKEQRKLILVTRETPLNPIHLENMLKLARLGALIMPPLPSFYNRPQSIGEIIDQFVGRILDHLDIANPLVKRWGEGSGETP
ncbi:MAG: flavin prenyltransferase [Clostridia bacterium]|nr:flavin prenyltransferase [Clostridia bacterium]